jgi:hypothetical protein
MVTEAQVRVLRRKLMEGKTQEAAAAGAGMSVRSERRWPLDSRHLRPSFRHGHRTGTEPRGALIERKLPAGRASMRTPGFSRGPIYKTRPIDFLYGAPVAQVSRLAQVASSW